MAATGIDAIGMIDPIKGEKTYVIYKHGVLLIVVLARNR
jgi:hypothetical protein